MARRRNAISHRFAKMRGLPPAEKALMQRIGTLLDSALNNRQSSNPFENARQITSRNIYPPTGILIKKGIRSVKIVWDAPPSNLLLRYEVTFDNLTTGERTIKSSFTNEVTFKAPKGTYIARVVSIGRDRSTSLVKTVQFTAGEDVMLLEGAKNGPLETGTLIQDDIRLLQGYNVYVWGSYVLDKYTLGNEVNPKTILKLYRSLGPDGTFATATLLETIEMYAATESASNIDSAARGGLVTRPISTTTLRDGSFETSQAVMFSPIPVVTADIDETFTYFLQATDRETDADEVNLSMTLWSGAVGDGDDIQGTVTPEPAYVFPNQNCFHTQIVNYGVVDSGDPALDTRSMWASVPEHANLIGNQHTIAIWFRPDDINASDMASGRSSTTVGNLQLLSRLAIRPPGGSGHESNQWQIQVSGVELGGGAGQRHQIVVSYRDEANTNTRIGTFSHSGITSGGNNDVSASFFSWGGAPTATNAQNDAWYFLVICFEGGDFVSDTPTKLRAYMNSATHPIGGAPIMLRLSNISTDGFEQTILQDDTDTMGYSIGDTAQDGGGNIVHNVSNGLFMGGLRTPNSNGDMQIHQLGIWNVALDRTTSAGSNAHLGPLAPVGLIDGGVFVSPIDYLFNAGFGTTVDWKKNSPLVADLSSPTGFSSVYSQSGNLCHLIQFGAVEQAMSSGFPGRDTGYHIYQGDMNFTGVTPEGRYIAEFDFEGSSPPTATNNGNHYTDNTTLKDILSPDGANGTTLFGKCHPGQNL